MLKYLKIVMWSKFLLYFTKCNGGFFIYVLHLNMQVNAKCRRRSCHTLHLHLRIGCSAIWRTTIVFETGQLIKLEKKLILLFSLTYFSAVDALQLMKF